MVKKKFTLGTAVRVSIETRDKDNVLTNVTSASITVTDPVSSNKVTDASMSNETTGKYFYTFQSAITDAGGIYTVKIVVVSGGYTSRKNIELFLLRDTVDA